MIRAIIEGHGEDAAVGVLLRRLLTELGIYDIGVLPDVRRPRSQLVTEGGIRDAIRTVRLRSEVTAVLALFDLDDDCARDIVPNLLAWGEDASRPLPFGLALARREYE